MFVYIHTLNILYHILIIHFIPLSLYIYLHDIYCSYLTVITTCTYTREENKLISELTSFTNWRPYLTHPLRFGCSPVVGAGWTSRRQNSPQRLKVFHLKRSRQIKTFQEARMPRLSITSVQFTETFTVTLSWIKNTLTAKHFKTYFHIL